jgi:hypothetical protein
MPRVTRPLRRDDDNDISDDCDDVLDPIISIVNGAVSWFRSILSSIFL